MDCPALLRQKRAGRWWWGGMASLLDPRICGPVPWGTHRPLLLEKLWSVPRHSACSEVPISPYTWAREPPEKGIQGTDCDHPLANLSWAGPGPPHPCKGWSRTSSQTPHELPGLPPESPTAVPGCLPQKSWGWCLILSANCLWLSWGTSTPPRAVLRHPQHPCCR